MKSFIQYINESINEEVSEQHIRRLMNQGWELLNKLSKTNDNKKKKEFELEVEHIRSTLKNKYSKKDIEDFAFKLGQYAFQDKSRRVAANDRDLMKLIDIYSYKVGDSLPIIKAWNKGWDKENLKN